jgi:pimeloyl-ACP methyl ester carboxylesterase
MPFATNNGTRIRYEVEGGGSPLVMVHGATVDLEMWHEMGYTTALRDRFRLILLDARGHGLSDKPHDPADYRPELMVGDVAAVLDELAISSAYYLGASMGAAIGFEMARHAPDRLHSLVLLGYGRYGPLTEVQQGFVTAGLRLFELGAAMGGEAVLAALDRQGAALSPATRAAYRANDWKALLAFQTAFMGWSGFEDVLPGVVAPCTVVAARSDPFYSSAQQCAAAMPHATFVPLVTGGHGQNSYPPELVVPHILLLF